MTTKYWPAPEVEEIAEKLIVDHHGHLDGEHIKYLYRDPPATLKGKVALGKARKVGGLNAHLVKLVGRDRVDGPVDFFVIEVAHLLWCELTEAQQRALVDHELCHLDVIEPDKPEEDRKLAIRGHDLEEFHDIVRRHGFWQPEIKLLVDAANAQLELDVAGESDAEAST